MLACITTACQYGGQTEPTEPTVSSIATLRNIETHYHSLLITDNITIEGRVTANDKYGEFNHCIIVEDQSAAVKILCDVDNLYRLYPIGSSLSISCSGLHLLNYYGGLTLGAEPTGEYSLDYIPQARLGQYVKTIENEAEPPKTPKIGVEELTPLHIFRCVELSNMNIRNNEGGSTYCARDTLTGRTIDTSHTLTDPYGQSLELFVDRQCEYADAPLPSSPCTIQAIIGYFDSKYTATITGFGICE